MINVELNETWLNGKYHLPEAEVEINTSLSYLSIQFNDGEEYFFQGDEAEQEIEEIFNIWNDSDITQDIAVSKYLQKF